jgi:hypothetical protein
MLLKAKVRDRRKNIAQIMFNIPEKFKPKFKWKREHYKDLEKQPLVGETYSFL